MDCSGIPIKLESVTKQRCIKGVGHCSVKSLMLVGWMVRDNLDEGSLWIWLQGIHMVWMLAGLFIPSLPGHNRIHSVQGESSNSNRHKHPLDSNISSSQNCSNSKLTPARKSAWHSISPLKVEQKRRCQQAVCGSCVPVRTRNDKLLHFRRPNWGQFELWLDRILWEEIEDCNWRPSRAFETSSEFKHAPCLQQISKNHPIRLSSFKEKRKSWYLSG